MVIKSETILIFFGAIIGVTIIASLGSIVSRKLKFNYGNLSILSVILYTASAMMILKQQDKLITIICSGLIGLYDGIVGWELMKKYKAYLGKHEGVVRVPNYTTAIMGLLFGVIIALLCTIFQ